MDDTKTSTHESNRRIFAILSLVFAVMGIASFCIWGVGAIFGACAVVFGTLGLMQKKLRPMSIVGLVLGIVGILISIFSLQSCIEVKAVLNAPGRMPDLYGMKVQDAIALLDEQEIDGYTFVDTQWHEITDIEDFKDWYVVDQEIHSGTVVGANRTFGIKIIDNMGNFVQDSDFLQDLKPHMKDELAEHVEAVLVNELKFTDLQYIAKVKQFYEMNEYDMRDAENYFTVYATEAEFDNDGYHPEEIKVYVPATDDCEEIVLYENGVVYHTADELDDLII